jgi:predicted esterase YcpF (UPF0227 family)
VKKLLVIHGFNSSPQSQKARQTVTFMQAHHSDVEVVCPQLQTSPLAAMAQLEEIINSAPQACWYLTGSSLGGYFATYLAEKYQLKAVLINPAVTPYLLLADYIGVQQQPYTGESYEITAEHMRDLKAFDIEQLSDKNRFMVMVQTGDEVLDYRQAVAKYQGCHLEVQAGGDHSFINFTAMLPAIVGFFQF